MIKLTTDTGETIVCTEDHEFYVDGSWVQAKDLTLAEATKKEYLESYSEPLFDLTVTDNHNYVITRSDIIVHNSGKGFVSTNFIDFDGKRLDVDALKTQFMKSKNDYINQKFAKDTGYFLGQIDLGNPRDTGILHKWVSDNKYDDKIANNFFLAQRANKNNKANVIMDVTLKNIKKLKEIKELADLGGYDPKNIHLVWIMNSFEVAMKQNAERERHVSPEIMFATHDGAQKTMKEIITNCQQYQQYVNGDIWIMFARAGFDTMVTKVNDKDREDSINKSNVFVVDKYNAIKVKSRGKSVNLATLKQNIIDKINEYIPKGSEKWEL